MDRIDLQERISSYNISSNLVLPTHRLMVNLRPVKTEEFIDIYCSEDDPFGKSEFQLGIALAKDLAEGSPYFRKCTIYQSKLVVEMGLGATVQDVFDLYKELSISYLYRSELSDPQAEIDVYCVPEWDLVNFKKYFSMMWGAFIARTLGEIEGIASKKDRTEHPSEILKKVLDKNPNAVSELKDGIRYGVTVDQRGRLSFDKPV